MSAMTMVVMIMIILRIIIYFDDDDMMMMTMLRQGVEGAHILRSVMMDTPWWGLWTDDDDDNDVD